ncbi:MAG TPA: DUF4920 domain-containing protein [Flavobacterium sp.]|nr:DUF4920 domain-containing protein [Flavobacterium sp.]
MKRMILLFVLFTVSTAFSQSKDAKYASFGKKITKEGALTKEQVTAKYDKLKKGDTIVVKFNSKIKDVCSKKGCWMNLELAKGKEAFVKFKDYAFFMPLNSAGSDVIVSGKAYVSVETVEELRHYAKDAGKSKEEIEKITKPETSYSFMADGVLIKE